jgi:hypothetical protein
MISPTLYIRRVAGHDQEEMIEIASNEAVNVTAALALRLVSRAVVEDARRARIGDRKAA